jgi:hypothetical protein
MTLSQRAYSERETLSINVSESNNSTIVLSVTFCLCDADYHYAEGRCAECHYAECRGAGADPIIFFVNFLTLFPKLERFCAIGKIMYNNEVV